MPEDELPPLHVGDHVTDRDSDDDAPMLVVYPPMGHGARSEVADGRKLSEEDGR